MTGQQLLRFLNDLRGGCRQSEAEELADLFQIDLSRPLVQLSSGMKRKVALLVVLSAHAPLLILDEPTNTLDPMMRRQFLEQLRRARNHGQAVLFSSHVLTEVEQVCDRVGILQRGRLVHLLAMDELRQLQKISIRFAKPVAAIPDFPGLQSVERNDGWVILLTDGPVEAVLQWLARCSVDELIVQSAGLERIYTQYH